MPQDTAQKLTKKQRKGLAFRQKIASKRRGGNLDPETENVSIPEPEVPNDDGLPETSENSKEESSSDRRKSTNRRAKENAQQEDHGEGDVKTMGAGAGAELQLKKRKRPQAEIGAGPDIDEVLLKQKKRKQKASDADENVNGEDTGNQDARTDKHKHRYILFVGNLKYTTSKEAIQAHFAHCDPPPMIRLLTPKHKSSSTSPKPTTKSKGCAFLEFTHRNALQQALKLHHSMVDGRQINVELTAGGGGKSATRLEKVKSRNKQLEIQRKTRTEKDPAAATDDSTSLAPNHAQRHSSTSGSGEASMKRRTWSIPEAGDEGAHRGGKKRGAKKRKVKDLGTGVNAIPVG